ncbi:MAG: bifunctional DedA family/phosphatase PAP2 family protein [Nanoarchaeota archaeon]
MSLEAFIGGLNWGNWNYLLIFCIALAESIIVFNPIVPGQTLVILSGMGAQQGLFSLSLLIFVTVLAVILGDCITYYLGRKYGLSFLLTYGKYFFFKKEYLKKTKLLMHNHLGKSIILGHMYGFTRSLVPFISGAHRSSFRKFLLFTTLGALLWSFGWILLGYFVGEGYPYIERYAGIVFLIVISGALCWYFLSASLKEKIISKESIILWTLTISSLLFFWSIMRNILREGTWARLDNSFFNTMQKIQDAPLTFISKALEVIFDTQLLLFFSILVVGCYLIYQKKKEAIFFGATMIVGALIVQLIKVIIHRARPDAMLSTNSGFSFPSGHAMIGTLFILLLLYSFWKSSSSLTYKISSAFLAVFFIVLVSASRVYLNAHYLSDVISGIALGMGIFALSRLSMNGWERLSKK